LLFTVTPSVFGQQIGATDRASALGGVSLENDAQRFAAGLVGQGKGKGFSVDYVFKGGTTDGAAPTASLIQDAAGNLYGTTSSGGGSGCSGFGCGIVFKLDTANHETVLHAFTDRPDGAIPYGRLVLDVDGSGNLYGTTSVGGTYGMGTVFKIDSSGTESVIYSFAGYPDGANPYAGLVMDNSGNLYGTTENGGTSRLGTIFKIDTGGNETVLHSFAGGLTDGADPKADLILDAAGNLYGTTFLGGSRSFGTVFELDTTNTETILHNFTGGTDGGNPFGGLTRDSGGTLYGTAENGGSRSLEGALTSYLDRVQPEIPHGCCKGVVFALSGSGEKVLYTFSGGNDGGTPVGDLALYNGLLYGTTLSGGPGQGHQGTAFSVTIANGNETVLHGFTGGKDGGTPQGGLLMNAAGVLYGTAEKGGGPNRHGTVFQYKTN